MISALSPLAAASCSYTEDTRRGLLLLAGVTDLEERADGLETADDVQRKAVVCQHVTNEPVRLVDDRRLVARRRRLLQHVNTKQ